MAAKKVERVIIEIPKRARRSITPGQMKECGELLSRASGNRPVVFVFDDRVVAIATSRIEKGRAASAGYGPWRASIPPHLQAEWAQHGIDLQAAVDRAKRRSQESLTQD